MTRDSLSGEVDVNQSLGVLYDKGLPYCTDRQAFRGYRLLCRYQDWDKDQREDGEDRKLRNEMTKLEEELSRVKG